MTRKQGSLGYTTEEFIARAKLVHGDKYDYSKTEYTGVLKRLTITCRVHGDFSVLANSHVTGNECQKCHIKQVSDGTRKTTAQFVTEAKAVHGDKYDYSKTAYTGARAKLTITCPEHGDFEQIAGDHITQKSGCRACQSCGFNTGKPGWLYILTAGNLVKVGITNREVDTRVKAISRTSQLDFKVHHAFYFESGSNAADTETQILRQLREVYKQPTELFDGSTECFYDVSPEALVERIDSMQH